MKLHALDIPDDAAELPAWLERHLVGLDLGTLVSELRAVHGTAAAEPALREVLGQQADAVLRGGLAQLSPDRLSLLLQHPELLADLQEQILTRGGTYWDRVAAESAALPGPCARGRERLAAFLNAPGAAGSAEAPSQAHRLSLPPRAAHDQEAMRPGARVRWYRHPAFVGLATAAAVLLAVRAYDARYRGSGVVQPPVVAATGWGWAKPDALPQDLTAPAYFNRLADAAQEWFNKQPEDAVTLAQRIGELRQGCSVLIFAEHRPLGAEDRVWLVEKCRSWAAKLDDQRVALEAGGKPEEVRAATDEVVQKLVVALRARADQTARG